MKTAEELYPTKMDAQKIKSVTKTEAIKKAYDSLMATNPDEVVSYGYSWLDDKIVGIMPGQIILVGGETGTGKSAFVNSIIYKNAKKGKKGAMFSLEEEPEDYEKKAIYFEIGRIRWDEGKSNYPWKDYITGALNKEDEFLEYFARAYEVVKNDNVVYQDVGEVKVTIDLVMERMKHLAKEGYKVFLIDHIHYFDSSQRTDSKTDYFEQVLVNLHLLVKKIGVSVILVAHYKKLEGAKPGVDSYKDSVAFSQIAHTVINLWRDRNNDATEEERLTTYFYIPKTRHLGGEGYLKTYFNKVNGEYDKLDEENKSFL